MSDIHPHDSSASPAPEDAAPLTVIPVRPARRLEPSPWAVLGRWLFRMVFLLSLAVNVFVVLVLIFTVGLGDTHPRLHENYHSGKKGVVADKIAVVRIDGVILEGLTGYFNKQIDQAAEDSQVKAVVLRINSPGGSITAADDLYKKISELANGNPSKSLAGKPIVVSMGSMAASGGYYIAMPAKHLLAERSTITGSIGVYASFPNLAKLAEKYGFKMETIKAGAVKDSGSMFHDMTPQERQLWQDMVDHAYIQFRTVVEEGRKGKLKYPLLAEITEERKNIAYKDEKNEEKKTTYVRQLADGGIFTADKAKKYGLIDEIGYLEDAIKEAKKQAGVGDDYKAITYERPVTLMNALLGAEAPAASVEKMEAGKLATSAIPRIWYLAPQSDLAGALAAMGKQ